MIKIMLLGKPRRMVFNSLETDKLYHGVGYETKIIISDHFTNIEDIVNYI